MIKKYRTPKLEELTKEMFKLHDSSFLNNIKPDWIKNSKPKLDFELTIFYSGINLAIEVGDYFKEVETYKKGGNDDTLKEKLCAENGIRLMSIKNPADLFSFARKFKIKLPPELRASILMCIDKFNKRKVISDGMINRRNKIIKRERHNKKVAVIQKKEKILNLSRMLARGEIDQEYYKNALQTRS